MHSFWGKKYPTIRKFVQLCLFLLPTWIGNFRYVLSTYFQSHVALKYTKIYSTSDMTHRYTVLPLFFSSCSFGFYLLFEGRSKIYIQASATSQASNIYFSWSAEVFLPLPFHILHITHIPKVEYTKMMSLSRTNLLCRSYIQ